ncbi:MAG: ABC transporter substrate-binding protein [Chloroflexota bacterium]
MRASWQRSGVLVTLVAAIGLLALSVIPASIPRVARAEPVKLTFWHYWDGKNGEVIQQLVDRYNSEHADVQVQSIFIGFNDLLPKLQAAAAGGEAPDIAAGDLIWMPKLARSGALVPLDDYLASSGTSLDDFYPALLNIGRYEDKLYSLPVSTNNLELFYNKDLFRKAGLDPEKPPKTWDELRQMAAACADPDQGIAGMELFTEPGEGLTWQFQVYLWQAGGDFLSPDLTKAAFNSPAGQKALQFWVDLIHTDKSAPLAPWGQFGQGKACMVMDGSWMVGIWSAEPPFDFGTAPMPYPTDGQPATNMGGEQLVLFSSTTERQQAAFDFMTWLTSTDVQIEWDKQTGFMPIRKSVAASPDYLSYVREQEPRLLPFIENQQYARNRPPVPNYPEISDAFSRQLEAALLGQTSVADALAAAERAVNALLATS